VLLVDDEPGVLGLLQGTLAQAGYMVTPTSTLQAAREQLARQPFDLVITDLYLGASDLGSELGRIAETLHPRPPVLVLTGRPSFGGAQEALRHHVDDIVTKPVDTRTLLRTCYRVMRESRLRRRNQELETVNRVLTSVLPRTIEMKDPTTSGHAERVVGYTDRLAERCGIGDKERSSLRLAALLHDIGKIGVPDSILTKPGPLTTDEMEIVKRHPAMGYEVRATLEDHDDGRTWVYQHHERWDGLGYPLGLGGEEVSLPGRSLILAEVYDALAEVRSYKPAWPTAHIASLFREQAGRQFDPELARLVADGLEREGKRFFTAPSGMLF